MGGKLKSLTPMVSAIRNRNIWLLVLPMLLVLAIFVYPLLEIFRQSLTNFVLPGDHGLDNYKWFFGNEVQITILIRTLVVSLLVAVICLILGFPYAYLMTLVGTRMRLVLLAVILLPFWTSLIVRLYAWVILLQPSGPLTKFLTAIGLGDLHILGTTWGVAIGSIQVLLPFLILPLYASLSSIDRRLMTAAESLGARPSSAFIRIYLPLATPGMLAGGTLVFVFMLGFYFTPAFLGSTRNSLISQQIVVQIQRVLAFGRAGAMALVLLILALGILGIVALFTKGLTKSLGIGGESE